MKLFPLFYLLFVAGAMYAQDTLSGVVNTYAAVQELNFCEGKIILGPASGSFVSGQQVLLIQMEGAEIDQSNSASFGNILQVHHAGHFEENEILGVNADTVWLRYTLLHEYEPGGAVQLVGFPQADEMLYLDSVVCLPWNGAFGGVLALQNTGTTSLLSQLSVDGAGFGDAVPHEVVSNCTWLTQANNYYYAATNWRGAPKGQGIAKFVEGKEHGRGPQANGGGGGNDHNSGGGGGAHAAQGGRGGRQTPSSTFGCYGNYPGLGGRALPLSPTRLFMGGEGGNGHVDDNNAGSPGARGGGILLLLTDTLFSNGFGLSANGLAPPQAAGDGAGGGGAGGSIYLSATTIVGNCTLSATGGKGGDVTNPNDRCFGPGGGGSGGRIIAPANANISTLVAGGEAGQNTTSAAPCSGLSNGAEAGQTGLVEVLFQLPGSEEAYTETQIIAQPQSISICQGDTAHFQFLVQGNFLHYQWQVYENATWEDLPNDTSASLTLLPGSPGLTNLRCLVSSPCSASLISDEVLLTTQEAPHAAFSIQDQGAGLFQFLNNSLNATTYSWHFGDGNTAAAANPLHQYQVYGSFSVTLIATNGCGADTAVGNVNFVPAPMAAFSLSPAEGCEPLTVFFENNSTGDSLALEWYFPGGNPSASTAPNPVVTYAQAGSFDARLIVHNAFGNDTLLQTAAVLVHPVPMADFSYTADSLTVLFQNQSQGALSYLWEFGDGSSNTGENPQHAYPAPGVYEVTLTVSNGPCGATVAQSIYLAPTAAEESAWPGLRIAPNPGPGLFRLSLGPPSSSQPIKIQVFDLLGQAILFTTTTGSEATLDLSEQPPGMYLLVLSQAGQQMQLRLLIGR